MSSLFLHKKKLEENRQEPIYSNRLYFRKLRYFLICPNCFWMASTLSGSPYKHNTHLKQCPVCNDRIYMFLIDNRYYSR